ncbi:ATPase, BadF/BadG/BcrA/BcrD type [Tsukamurella pulmonis]|uniref:N-acetylglucosamine kinase n=2 Tax=Tsukamurella pulmonis TaxID=47312 RepID=UPI00079B1EC6|nr:BadF/BadG/BcrA/BcrD ATPase family protein [Tsukamurella pulmonis]KXP09499.1 ATPase [Tsukamurella pulmonis]BDD82783.1 ATPase, BadF/BadG/BcrA/BcrD type [Tsukamurella pulmonis]
MNTAVIGLDIGGSKTQAVRAENGVVVTEALSGSANISSVGRDEAGRQLDIALARLGVDGVGAVCAGAAGVETPAGAATLTALLAERVPGARIRVVHDSQLILAAAGVRDGIAVISGTGAVAWGRKDERRARAGGWGYLLGDEGSGYWVAKEAVRRTLIRLDRDESADHLGQQLAADCGLQGTEELLDHFYAQQERRYWAGRARVVFELAQSGDAASIEIVEEAARALTDIAVSVAERIGSTGPVVLAGGLAVHQPALQRRVRHHLGMRGISDLRVLTVDPVRGAVQIALRELGRRGAQR